MTTTPTINPGNMVDGLTSGVTSGVNENLGEIALVGGGLLAIGVVWRLVRRFVK